MVYENEYFKVETKYVRPDRMKQNPIIMADYISSINDVNVSVKDENKTYFLIDNDRYDNAYLPVYDTNGKDIQLIVSEQLLNKIASVIFNISEYRDKSPWIIESDVFFMLDKDQKPISQNCTTDILEEFLPGITKDYGKNVSCFTRLKIMTIGDFNINTGRVYAKGNYVLKLYSYI